MQQNIILPYAHHILLISLGLYLSDSKIYGPHFKATRVQAFSMLVLDCM
jgi:hypothetical protein